MNRRSFLATALGTVPASSASTALRTKPRKMVLERCSMFIRTGHELDGFDEVRDCQFIIEPTVQRITLKDVRVFERNILQRADGAQNGIICEGLGGRNFIVGNSITNSSFA